MAFKSDSILNNDINEQPEDTWTIHKEGSLDVQSLTHTFGNNKTLFEIIENNILFYPNNNVTPYVYTLPLSEYNDPVIQKAFIINTIDHFQNEKSPNNWDMDKYLQSLVDKIKPSPEIETAKKMGYVQGVCECVAVVGGDRELGKKLLTEMNVTKDMAKKFANPETYKTLEQGIFAEKQEQKLEQTQSIKL